METASPYNVAYMATPPTNSTPAPGGDSLELLRAGVRGFARTANLQAYVLLDEDGFHPALRTYHVKLSGPDVREAVKAKGISVEAVIVEAKKAWRTERRKTEVFRLVEDCQRLVGGCLDEDFEAGLIYQMQACEWTAFNTLAAKWRTKAVAYKNQQAA